MELTRPASLDHVLTDGAFAAAGFDQLVEHTYGRITAVEFNSPADSGAPDLPVSLRLHTDSDVHDCPGQRIAFVRSGRWEWATEAIRGIEIAALHDGSTSQEQLVQAARTLVGGQPVFVIPVSSQEQVVVAAQLAGRRTPTAQALSRGMELLPAGADHQRALAAYAASHGLEATETATGVSLSDGTQVSLRGGRIVEAHAPGADELSFNDILADAFFPAVEHQLLIDGLFPSPSVYLNVPQARARVVSPAGSVEGRAQLVATIAHGRWTWAWADPYLLGLEVARAAGAVKRLGAANGIMELTSRTIPAAAARHEHLGLVALPIMGMWSLFTTPLNEHTTGLVVVEHPELALPAPTPEAAAATLQVELPEGVDARRALASYARFRGLRLEGASLVLPGGARVECNPAGRNVNPRL